MNKIALISCSLGVDVFHRRDLDTKLMVDAFENTHNVFPIEYEIKYLGQQLKYAKDDGVVISKNICLSKKVTVVGGNYFEDFDELSLVISANDV